jgi:hypothetical protein
VPPPFPPGRPVSFANGPGARLRAWTKAHRRTTIAAGVALGLLLIYMLAGGALAAHRDRGQASAKSGRPVTIGGGHGGLRRHRARSTSSSPARRAAAAADGEGGADPAGRRRWACAARARSTACASPPCKGGAADNVSALVERLRGRGKGKDKAEPTDGGGSSSAACPTS